jgi:hypothetical protein
MEKAFNPGFVTKIWSSGAQSRASFGWLAGWTENSVFRAR